MKELFDDPLDSPITGGSLSVRASGASLVYGGNGAKTDIGQATDVVNTGEAYNTMYACESIEDTDAQDVQQFARHDSDREDIVNPYDRLFRSWSLSAPQWQGDIAGPSTSATSVLPTPSDVQSCTKPGHAETTLETIRDIARPQDASWVPPASREVVGLCICGQSISAQLAN